MKMRSNIQKNIDASVKELREQLHSPARFDNLGDLDHHLEKTARLARALWEFVCNPEACLDEDRTRAAAEELAGEVSDHASAARFVYQREKITGRANLETENDQ